MILNLSDGMYWSDKLTYHAYILAIEWLKSLTNNNIITCGHNSKALTESIHKIKCIGFN